MRLLYVVGPPGVGKSAAVASLTRNLAGTTSKRPLWHTRYAALDALQLGRPRPLFPGTDTLPYSVIGPALDFMASCPARTVLAEGDRLACDRFLQGAVDAGYDLELVHLTADPAKLAARRHQRGTEQAESWLKGRTTKAAKLAARWSGRELDTTGLTPEQVAEAMTGLSAAAAELAGA